jgi:tetratricopeptide (TPR) repeat protein
MKLKRSASGIPQAAVASWLAIILTLPAGECPAQQSTTAESGGVDTAPDSAVGLDVGELLYRSEPFDQIKVRDGEKAVVLRIRPVDFPQGRLPSPPPSKIRVHLLDRPDTEYEVLWKDLLEYKTFAELVRTEADQWVARNQFDDAYRAYAYLLANHPDTPGLRGAIGNYLLQHARQSFRANRNEEALGLLLQLKQYQPDDGVTNRALERVLDRLIEGYVGKGDFHSAHAMLAHLSRLFPEAESEILGKWQAQLKERAAEQLAAAQRYLDQQEFQESLLACRTALRIWPGFEDARRLEDQLRQRYPQVSVAVAQPYTTAGDDPLLDWSVRRKERLTERRLTELVGQGADGNIYSSPFGKLTDDETGRLMRIETRQDIRLPPDRKTMTAYDLFGRILSLAESSATSRGALLAQSLESLGVDNVFGLTISLRKAYPRPAALLAVRLFPQAGAGSVTAGMGPFRVADHSNGVARYVVNDDYFAANGMRLRQIVERTFVDHGQSIQGLIEGTVDAIDRVYPWEMSRLPPSEEWNVAEYAFPTVHVLIPNRESLLMSRPAMRRAIAYGIDRQAILDEVLFDGKAPSGNVVISGPFPLGRSLDDSMGAASDRRIRPRPYEPRLAMVLAAAGMREASGSGEATRNNVEAEGPSTTIPSPDKASSPNARFPPILLAHPPDPLAERACQAIEQQLKRIGIPLVLKRLSVDAQVESARDYDLLYAELALWEPLVDVHRLFGERGLVSPVSPYLHLALQDLIRAARWADAREQLYRIHRLVHDELPVVPLWQTYNQFAYRSSVAGIGEYPVVLYQQVESWTLTSEGGN